MSRDIEFRAYNLDKKEMWYSDNPYYAQFIATKIASNFKELENLILMQYTGLKDKNGKKIFEGDIVKNTLVLENNTFTTNIDIVEFNQEDCSFMLSKGKRHFNKNLDLEVIGNIYENNEDNYAMITSKLKKEDNEYFR